VNKAHPSALGTSFHRLGGVYPVARFVNALVDAVLAPGSKLRLPPLGDDADPLARRHAAGLKYVVTELVCHALDGPEVATVQGFDDAKLGIRADEWELFLEMAQDTSRFFPTPHHRNLAMRALEAIKPDLCIGLAADESGDVTRFADDGAAMVPSRPPPSTSGGGLKCPFFRSGSADSAAANSEDESKCPFRPQGGWKAWLRGGTGNNMPEKLSNSDAQAAMTLADKGIDLSMIASKFPQRDCHRYNQDDSNNAYAPLSFVVLSLSLFLSLSLSK
jgi:hypothetical protein